MELLGYERVDEGHGFEVVRDLDLWGQAVQRRGGRFAKKSRAEAQLAELRTRTESLGLDLSKFWTTYENWKTGILNYFDGRYTSAAVEGINNKARVITKRCYGLKTAKTLFSRLILDLNRASEAVGRSIAELRETAAGLKAVFLAFCT